jgi:hypothetical protein
MRGRGNRMYERHIFEVLGDDELYAKEISTRLQEREAKISSGRLSKAVNVPTPYQLSNLLRSPLFVGDMGENGLKKWRRRR